MIFNIFLLILSIIIIFGIYILLRSNDSNVDNADYLIVLGHKLTNNKPNRVLLYRLNGTLDYARQNNCKIILCGGITLNNTKSEASIMKEYLLNNKIDENRIILEDKSTDTVENISNCKEYIKSKSNIVLLSSNYHIVRSKMICKLFGLNVKGIGVYTPVCELLKHLIIEEIFIFIHYFRIKKKGA